MDHEGIKILLEGADEAFPRLSYVWLDGGYRGEDKGADWVEKALGWSAELIERPRKPAPQEVLRAWAREWAREDVKVDLDKFMQPGLPGAAEKVGGGADDRLDRPQQEDEQGLRAATGDRRSIHLRGDEPPDAQALGTLMRLFGQSRKQSSPNFRFTEFSEVWRREDGPKANRRPFFMPRSQPSSTMLVVPVVLVDDGMTLTA
jgi:hypothetical protein